MERRTLIKSIATAFGAASCAAPGVVLDRVQGGPFVERSDGARLFYRDWGSGSPIVFIHPWALSADIWEYQLTASSELGLRCVAYDRRGHGRSSDPGRGYDFDTLADDLGAVLEQLDLRQATLVGYSMGGAEVIRYLSRHGSDRVSRAVLVSPVGPDPLPAALFEGIIAGLKLDRPAFMARNISAFVGTDLVSPELSQWVLQQFLAASPQAILACTQAIATGDHREHLRAMTVPTLIVQGDADQVNPLDLTGRKLADAIATSELRVYPGAPHGLGLTHRERFMSDLFEFTQG